MKVFKTIIFIILVIITTFTGGVLLIADLAPFCTPEHFTLPSILALGYEWILLINLLILPWWLLSRYKWFIFIHLFLFIISAYSIFQTTRITHVSPTYEHSLKILSYNTCRLNNFRKPAENGLLHYLKQQDADIIFLQEIEMYKNSNKYLTLPELKSYLSGKYPYSYIDFVEYRGKRQYGVAIFSKYPLRNKHTIPFDSRSNIADYCDVIVQKDTFRLFNNHLESNKLRKTDIDGESLSNDAEMVIQKLTTAFRSRAKEADIVHQAIAESPYPVIVCGDFNDVPQSYTTRQLSKGIKDAFLQSRSWSLGHTIKKKGIGLRIDYILHSKTFQSSDFQIDKVLYSDHYPISCTLYY